MSEAAIIWVVSVSQFLTPYMLSSVGVALPSIGREFSAGAVALGLVEVLYMLSGSMLLLPMGRFSDIYGRKKLFAAGMVVMALCNIILPMVPTIRIFIIFRFIQGIGASMIISTSLAILTSSIPTAKWGRALGFVVGSTYLGLSAGPSIAGLMITHLGWRWVFYIAIPAQVMALSLTLWKLREEGKNAANERFDWSGALTYMTALPCLILGMSYWKEWAGAKWAAGCGAILLLMFIRHELRVSSPLVSIRSIIRNRTFAFSNLATFLNYTAASGTAFYFSLYLQSVRGLSPQATGFVMVVQPIMMAVTSLVAGRLSDRYAPAKIATLGVSLCTMGLLIAAFIAQASSLCMVLGVLMLLGFGFGIFSSPNTAVIMSSVQARDYGMASSMAATMRSMGMLVSMTIVTFVLSHFMGKQPVTVQTSGDFMTSMGTTFIIFGILSAVGIGCSLRRIAPGPAQG
jgi:MFS family permease